MKTKNRIWICHLIVMGLVLILTNSCKKDDNNITDIDGNLYHSVTIGTQVWMVENLKISKYRNGDLIGTTTPATLYIFGESTPKYQWAYDGNESNVATYGRLYTWYAVSDSRNVCPTGWHVPTDAEWITLTTFLGADSVAGGKLKETGTTHWTTPNKGATNETGFTALPGGGRGSRVQFGFNSISNDGNWWSSTEYSDTIAYIVPLWYSSSYLYISRWVSAKQDGYSVRCLKD
jgi:uncharacterized protein (TIGR02145 family)